MFKTKLILLLSLCMLAGCGDWKPAEKSNEDFKLKNNIEQSYCRQILMQDHGSVLDCHFIRNNFQIKYVCEKIGCWYSR
jgi:hypothetical protein